MSVSRVVSVLARRDFVFITMVLSMLLIILGLHSWIFYWHTGLFVGGLFLFGAIDAYLYRYLLVQEAKVKPEKNKLIYGAYKILYVTILLLIFSLLTVKSFLVGVLFIVTWHSGFADVLYYHLLRLPFKYDNMVWECWTLPLGPVIRKFKLKLSYKILFYQAKFVFFACLIFLILCEMRILNFF